MKSPITGKEMILKKEDRFFNYKNKQIKIEFSYYLCEDSQERFTTSELDDKNLSLILVR